MYHRPQLNNKLETFMIIDVHCIYCTYVLGYGDRNIVENL